MSDPLRLEPLYPAGAPEPVADVLARVRPAERAPAERPFTFLNMIATLDGRAALEGHTTALGGDADLAVLLELRGLADAILIGTGTLHAEGYDRLVRAEARRARRTARGQAEDPLAVLLTRGAGIPWDAQLFTAPDQSVLVYTGATVEPPAGVAAPVEVARLPDPTPAAALADLRARGVRALLCEGGPTLNRALLEAGLVDELFLTLSPLVTADDREPAIVAGPPLPVPVGMEMHWVLRHGQELFLRYAVARG